MASEELEGFATWQEVLDYQGTLYYQAPLDRHPVFVGVVKRFRNGKLRLAVAPSGVTFTADAGHLSRMRRRSYAARNPQWKDPQSSTSTDS